VAKMSVLLSKRAEVLFSVDAKDQQTGCTALMSASQRGHHKVLPSRHGTGSHFVTQRPSDPGIQRPGDPVDPV